MCLKAVGQLLDTRKENIPEKQCILDALAITMTSNSCNFMGKYFTQVDGATIGGPESASVTDIYGAVFIDSKIEENIINENEDWKWYIDDSFSISLLTSKEREIEKTEWMNNNIVKDTIKFTMECSQDEMIFLDTKIIATPISDKQVVITTDMYSKKTDTHQYLNPNSCHPKNQTKSIPIGVADRIRRNCSDNVINDVTYRERLIEYKAYLMKSGHSEKDIDNGFCNRLSINRRETLKKKSNKKQNNKIKFITEYEPSLPDIYTVWRKNRHLLKNNEELKNIFENDIKDFQLVYRKGGKNIKEWLCSANINTIDYSNAVHYGCYSCGRNCIDCKYLKDKGENYYSHVTMCRYKIRQNVNCQSRNVIYLVTCKRCKKQGVGETINFKSRMANYRSCIKNKKVSCNIDKHFIEEDNHSLEDFDVQIIVQLENVPCNKDQARKRRKQFEGYWQITLCTLAPYGLNSINELEANLKWNDKNIFYPMQDQ